jgi:hypothetical protein
LAFRLPFEDQYSPNCPKEVNGSKSKINITFLIGLIFRFYKKGKPPGSDGVRFMNKYSLINIFKSNFSSSVKDLYI